MIWLFASIVLILTVYNAAFRKVSLWVGGVAAIVLAVLFTVVGVRDHRAVTADDPNGPWHDYAAQPAIK
jgi:uncharacterized protein YqfA (UPF0365 family)